MPKRHHTGPPDSQPVNDWLVARHSPVHGTGLFTTRPVPAGTRLIEYLGERITKAESLSRCQAGNVYIVGLDAETDLDGKRESNFARFINHSCAPNCELVLEEEVTLGAGSAGATVEYRVFIDALRDIPAGEEISFNYGFDLVDYREHPCRCGAASCVGFIVAEEFFPDVRRQAGA